MTLTEQLWSIYSSRGGGVYFGEVVTTLEHSLQTAYFAQESNAADALVVAALLHDIGHLIDSAPPDFADWQSDARHEVSGSNRLAQRFGPEVSEPVRLHVPAKRYRCAPFHRDSIQLRRLDDRGKVAGLRTPDFGHYRGLIEAVSRH